MGRPLAVQLRRLWRRPLAIWVRFSFRNHPDWGISYGREFACTAAPDLLGNCWATSNHGVHPWRRSAHSPWTIMAIVSMLRISSDTTKLCKKCYLTTLLSRWRLASPVNCNDKTANSKFIMVVKCLAKFLNWSRGSRASIRALILTSISAIIGQQPPWLIQLLSYWPDWPNDKTDTLPQTAGLWSFDQHT